MRIPELRPITLGLAAVTLLAACPAPAGDAGSADADADALCATRLAVFDTRKPENGVSEDDDAYGHA